MAITNLVAEINYAKGTRRKKFGQNCLLFGIALTILGLLMVIQPYFHLPTAKTLSISLIAMIGILVPLSIGLLYLVVVPLHEGAHWVMGRILGVKSTIHFMFETPIGPAFYIKWIGNIDVWRLLLLAIAPQFVSTIILITLATTQLWTGLILALWLVLIMNSTGGAQDIVSIITLWKYRHDHSLEYTKNGCKIYARGSKNGDLDM